MLININNNCDTWMGPNGETFWKYITNYKSFRSDNYLKTIFHNIFYDDFLKGNFYPIDFNNKVINKINNNENLKECMEEFNEKYKNSINVSFFGYLDRIIIPIIGKEKFCNYIKNMCEIYVSQVNSNILTVNINKLFYFIFGKHRYLCTDMVRMDNIKDKIDDEHIYYLLLKEFFPYIIVNYTKPKRFERYKYFKYSEEEQAMLEKRFNELNKMKTKKYYIDYSNSNLNICDCGLEEKEIEEMYCALDNYFEELKKNRKIVYFREFVNNLKDFKDINQNAVKNIISLHRNSNIKMLVHKYYDEKLMELKAFYCKTNQIELKTEKDIYVLYIKNKDNYDSLQIDFSRINHKDIKSNLLKYYAYLEKQNTFSGINTLKSSRKHCIAFLEFISKKYNIERIDFVKEWHVLSFLNDLDIVYKLSPNTISQYLMNIRKFYNYYGERINKGFKNPTLNISFSNIEDHKKATPIIPDDILVFLDNNISKIKQKDIGLIYRLLSETGWRIGDVIDVKTKDIYKEEKEIDFAIIKVSTNKTKKARIKAGLGDIIEDRISISLYNDLLKYIEETKKIREEYNIDTIFFSIQKGVISKFSTVTFNNAINIFLQENNIISLDETYYNFSSRQTRKTVASNLISNNVSSTAIQKKLGHTSIKTTEKYYAEVNKKRISELNHGFYKEKFDIYMDEEKLKLFTEEERRILYVDFALGYRNTELGVCSKHPSEGRCVHLGQKSCAACPKLCTGKAYLEQWQKLMNDSYNLLIQFEKKYKKSNIPEEEYQNFIEYKQEKRLYEQYKSVVESIERSNK